ncbi:LAQU0S01e05270g1_1 [Lachancea quebecensis]|uniref:DNA polymerase n=1 Tax=Lachancea quebecensis TaxID=1654605 RepID=A0A0P1KM05_9SACH|nr:LAQU0S01e05270g1_1 [Lachancea quebecensis]
MSNGAPKSGSLPALAEDLIHIQINSYDSYQEVPRAFDRLKGNSLPGREFSHVPVIRVYGSLPSGHNVLCHIHGVFPYMYIPYDGEKGDSVQIVQTRCTQLHSCLETKLKEAYSRKSSTGEEDENAGSLKFVADVSPIKAVPFYGYHVGYSVFYKISLLSPTSTTKTAELLRDGKVTGKSSQVFEAHIPFLLQFSADYNLFGCSWLKLSKCFFRSPLLNPAHSQDLLQKNDLLDKFILKFYQEGENESGNSCERIGNSLLEIDVIPQYIRNRNEIDFRDIHGTLFESSQAEHEETLFIPSTKNLWTQTTHLRKQFGLEPYQPTPEKHKFSQLPEWQSHKELLTFLEKAKNRTIPKSESFSQSISKSTFRAVWDLELPHESLRQLWPNNNPRVGRFSRFCVQSQNTGSGASYAQSTSDNIVYSPDSETMSESDLEVKKSSDSESTKAGQKTGAEARLRSSVPLSPQKDIEVTNSFSDQVLTQSMAQKRPSNRVDLLDQKPKKLVRHAHAHTISAPSSGFRYKKFSLDYHNILQDLENRGMPKIDYLDPYFRVPEDLKKKDYIYSGRRFSLHSTHVTCRRSVEFTSRAVRLESTWNDRLPKNSWKYAVEPPSYSTVHDYLLRTSKVHHRSQIDFKTMSSERGYKFKSNHSLKGLNSGDHNPLSHLTLEIFATSRENMLPDPKVDTVKLVFWKIDPDSFPIDIGISTEGIMAYKEEGDEFASHLNSASWSTPVAFFQSEEDMISGVADLVLLLDPDILSGFEVHSSSWGYLIERFESAYERDLCEEIARVKYKPFNKRKDVWGFSHDSGIHVAGRHTLNIWRLLRSGINLLQYTLENIAFHVLHERLPHFSPSTLTSFWENRSDMTALTALLSYWKKRVNVNMKLLQSQQTIQQTIEQARLIGIDFYSVISRGSQYKVESVLVRLCKCEHFLVLSPSKTQVRDQKALECIPLVMEPESAFYKSPLVVLDFQSLYPSIMIGYNYCYSTVIGTVHEFNAKKNVIGASKAKFTRGILHELENHLTISPNGVMYLKESVRKSMLAKMLTDILHTRLMIKATMNDLKSKNETISKLLNNKQIALKLLANVTYGYTSASFSGRMPCSDVADSIVQTGRETLEKAIMFIENHSQWGAKVVYGDTDSLFVYFPGKSREEAFKFGRDMAKAITACNPFPITLKFEKVYHPCLLVSKKRYVGYSFEKENQKEPKFDAKGIETVRRDGHPAQQKIVEKSLRILFDSRDLSAVKSYIQDQFRKIMKGQVSIQDFCFAREVKLGSYKSEKTAPPGAVVASKKKAADHRAEPQYRERVPYIVVKGRPGQILRERCVSPETFLSSDSLELDATYYITKTLLPPLQRFFNLIGVDVSQWYVEMPRFQDIGNYQDGNLPEFMRSTSCFSCKKEIREKANELCAECLEKKGRTVSNLLQEDFRIKKHFKSILKVCKTCCEPLTKNSLDNLNKVVTKCEAQECPVYYSRVKYKGYMSTARSTHLKDILKGLDQW